MKNLPFWFIFLGSLFALVGMGVGIYMGISEDHSLIDAHAHNNLIGWVTMALYGFYYKAVPAAAAKGLARLHFVVALIGSLTIGIGIAMAQQGITWLAEGASLFVIVGMALFAWTVWTNRGGLATG